jgi:hypothetical protein
VDNIGYVQMFENCKAIIPQLRHMALMQDMTESKPWTLRPSYPEWHTSLAAKRVNLPNGALALSAVSNPSGGQVRRKDSLSHRKLFLFSFWLSKGDISLCSGLSLAARTALNSEWYRSHQNGAESPVKMEYQRAAILLYPLALG